MPLFQDCKNYLVYRLLSSSCFLNMPVSAYTAVERGTSHTDSYKVEWNKGIYYETGAYILVVKHGDKDSDFFISLKLVEVKKFNQKCIFTF